MDFERFREFMLQSAARHDSEMARLREIVKKCSVTADKLIENQVHLRESIDLLIRKRIEESEQRQRASEWEAEQREREIEQRQRDRAQAQAELQDLRRIVFRHVTDPDAHKSM